MRSEICVRGVIHRANSVRCETDTNYGRMPTFDFGLGSNWIQKIQGVRKKKSKDKMLYFTVKDLGHPLPHLLNEAVLDQSERPGTQEPY